MTRIFDLGSQHFLIGRCGCHLDLPDADIPDTAIRIEVDGSGLCFEGVGSFTIPLGSVSVAVGQVDLGKSLSIFLDPYEILIELTQEPGEPLDFRDGGIAEPDPAAPRSSPDLDETMFSPATARDEAAPRSRDAIQTLRTLDLYWLGLDGEYGETRLQISTSPFRIGRTESEMILKDHHVSAKHAQLEILGPSHFLLKDLASTNGTTVNGRPISASSLRNGDVVGFGGIEFRFVAKRREAP